MARNLTGGIRRGGPLRGFSAEFLPGVTAVIGPEGSGKAALLAMLAGHAKPTAGDILIGSPGSMVPVKEFKGSVGYLPGDARSPRGRTIGQVLVREALAKGLKKDVAYERVELVLRTLGLSGDREARIADCADDTLRRLAIAAAMLPDPGILLLEEPFTGLLPQEQMRFRAILAGMPRGKIVVAAVCDPAHAETGVDWVLFLSDGRLVFSAPKDRLAAALRGKVWLVTAPQEDAWQIRLTYVVSAQQRVFTGQQLRVVSEEPPAGALMAVPEEPLVQDAYSWCMARGPERLREWIQISGL